MRDVHKGQRRSRHKRHADEAVGNSAMVLQPRERGLQAPKHVHISGFGGKHHGYGRERALAVEACTSQAAAGQQVSERVQVFPRLSFGCGKRAIVRRQSEATESKSCRIQCISSWPVLPASRSMACGKMCNTALSDSTA